MGPSGPGGGRFLVSAPRAPALTVAPIIRGTGCLGNDRRPVARWEVWADRRPARLGAGRRDRDEDSRRVP
jgi:hypothetical protein